MNKIIVGDPKKDFFQQNPQFEVITIFKELQKSEKDASQIMWSIYLSEHPNSVLYRIKDLKERRKEISDNYYNIDWDKYNNIINEFLKYTLSDNQRSFKIWRDKARELDDYIKNLNFETADDKIIKLFEKAKVIWTTLDLIEKRMSEDETQGTKEGGGQISGREKRWE